MKTPKIAILIPCYNEASTIGHVVRDFQGLLPTVEIYICDNNSTDNTAEEARKAGATVLYEWFRGKGLAVRRLFSDVEADIYILVDGDSTYECASAPKMIETLINEKLDMVVGTRETDSDFKAFPLGHAFGNRLLSGFLGLLFGTRFTDVLSGYRVFSRRFVKSFPALASGFETEVELSIHALSLRMAVAEIPTLYKARPGNSSSKLHTWRDGLLILFTIVSLFKGERPLIFFSIGFILLAGLSLILGYPVVMEFLKTSQVPRFPTAILATGIMLLAFLSLTCGLILDTVTRGRREMKRLFYLAIPGIGATND